MLTTAGSAAASRLSSVMLMMNRCLTLACSFGACCSKVALTVIGPLLATVATLLIAFVVSVYFLYTFPLLTSHFGYSQLSAVLLTAVGVYLLVQTVFHYFSTMLISPGTPPENESWSFERRALLALDPEISTASNDTPSGQYRFCKRCDRIKPQRTHHCSICNRCVLKMDHHCPWVNNCVGYHNYRHFVLFTVYLFLVAAFFLSTSWLYVKEIFVGRPSHPVMMLACVISISGSIAALIFIAWNSFLIARNESTIEFYSSFLDHATVGSRHYDMGIKQNFLQVFGPNVWATLLLPIHTALSGDGCLFPMNNGRGFPLPQLVNDDHKV